MDLEANRHKANETNYHETFMKDGQIFTPQ